MTLSNRKLGFLIILGIIGFIYIYFEYFFVLHKTNLEIISNVNYYSGTLYNIKYSTGFSCYKKKCNVSDIPMFEYNLHISKEKYKDFDLKINLKNKKKISINLKKNIIFDEVKEEKLTNKQLVEKLKNKKTIFYKGQNLEYKNIINNDNYVYIREQNSIIFYNFKNNYSFKIELIPYLNYIKYSGDNIFIINTDVGSFNFNISTKKIEYISIFDDYILLNGNYVGIVHEDNLRLKKNFGFEEKYGDLVIFYDLKTKEKQILKNAGIKITQIYLKNSKVFIKMKDGSVYEIKNL